MKQATFFGDLSLYGKLRHDVQHLLDDSVRVKHLRNAQKKRGDSQGFLDELFLLSFHFHVWGEKKQVRCFIPHVLCDIQGS